MDAKDRLILILDTLPSEFQEAVVSYAESLKEALALNDETTGKPRFYICRICFKAANEQQKCHGQLMMPCNAAKPEDCKPLEDAFGNLKSRAPKWFINSVNEVGS